MNYRSQRRALLLVAATTPLVMTVNACAPLISPAKDSPSTSLAALERSVGGRLGVCAIDTANGKQVQYRANERFPFCSTFKAMLGAAVLAQSVERPQLLQQLIVYQRNDLVDYSPVTEQHVGTGMTVADLCRALFAYSDNSAANLLTNLVGGPTALTAYARSIGDNTFRLDRLETELDSSLPGDPRDTTTPAAMAASLNLLTLGNALPAAQRELLVDWLRGNKVGDKRIRAGVPAGWMVGDKTGTGDYGTTNDVGVVWPPARLPIVLAIYYTQTHSDAKPREDVVAAAARIALGLA
ncbi:PenA family class A beta-lactamase [Burkholderia lata]|uniref:Beta-lactamase n=1 Tax=Burkholderia lata (strain ATCC 17760 / DSM 23089 / LMG 22485 / NCIMB 9086 / R18194 / 383) TaxID=482957 RepID=A0A6P2UPK2_BURL3|nr:class A beta-lactamase [Burkholderia lata]VWC76947.1 PenA family class A beta-lactamase [Burkholderia lata]